jgi:very-short-patch-repair endonuclease
MNKTQIFIEKAKLKHGEKFDYSKVNYINNYTNIIIVCKLHGEYTQIPYGHLRGRNGCEICKRERISKGNKKDHLFINRAVIIHDNKYDYSNMNYIDANTKIKIVCPIHGEFSQEPSSHLKGYGCIKCGVNNTKKSKDSFINESNLVHDYKYDYINVEYINSKIKVRILCPIHGEFKQIPNDHRRGSGCSLCNESKGEKIICKLLTKCNIKFERQKIFKECKYTGYLPLDFYLNDLNIVIEFNGRQHYESVKWFGGDETYKAQIIKDKIKMDFCNKNRISFIVIHYKDIEHIQEKLQDHIKMV